MRINKFNTGRHYDERGQEIAWTVNDKGVVFLWDDSRKVDKTFNFSWTKVNPFEKDDGFFYDDWKPDTIDNSKVLKAYDEQNSENVYYHKDYEETSKTIETLKNSFNK